MSRKKSVVSQEGSPVLFEVWKWDTKINIDGNCIPSEYELESIFRGVVYASLVELPFVVHHEFGVMTEEVRKIL